MKNLKAKLRKNGGFTLIEMLIVVAIIAILIAISIPLVGSALERAREATDASNERSFKAALVTAYLLGEADMQGTTTKIEAGKVYAYDAANGVVSATTIANGYGQGTTGGGGKDANKKTDMILIGGVNATGEAKIWWVDEGATIPTTWDGTAGADNLTGPLLNG